MYVGEIAVLALRSVGDTCDEHRQMGQVVLILRIDSKPSNFRFSFLRSMAGT